MNINNSTKKVIIYATIFFVIIFLIGLIFFRKDNDDSKENNPEINKQQIIENVEKKEITEDKKIKSFAEDFTITYHSYTWGKFSNIEAQYYYMTYAMKDRETNKVKQLKEGIKNQPQKYFTVRAGLIDSNFVSYKEAEAILEINLAINNYAGAIVQRETMIWVDEKGDYYEGDLNNLLLNTSEKKIKIEMLKFDGEWKVDKIEEI